MNASGNPSRREAPEGPGEPSVSATSRSADPPAANDPDHLIEQALAKLGAIDADLLQQFEQTRNERRRRPRR